MFEYVVQYKQLKVGSVFILYLIVSILRFYYLSSPTKKKNVRKKVCPITQLSFIKDKDSTYSVFWRVIVYN